MTQALSTQLSELEKLEEFRTLAAETTCKWQWNRALWMQNHYQTKSFSRGDYVLWFPNACMEHISKFIKRWFGPYKIQYCLFNNKTLLVIVNKFDPNPILVNINKLKLYWFQNTTASKGLESIVKKGRDITNIKIGFKIATLENAHITSTKISFSMDKTEIKKSWFDTKNMDSIVGTWI